MARRRSKPNNHSHGEADEAFAPVMVFDPAAYPPGAIGNILAGPAVAMQGLAMMHNGARLDTDELTQRCPDSRRFHIEENAIWPGIGARNQLVQVAFHRAQGDKTRSLSRRLTRRAPHGGGPA